MIKHVIANEGVAEMRRQPDHAAEQVSQVVLGTPLTVLGRRDRDRWLRVESPDGYRGWVRSWSVHPVTREELNAYRNGPMVEVDAMLARLREKPTSRSRPLREAPLGSRLPRVGRSGKWFRLLLPDGMKGYLNARDLLLDRKTMRPRHRPRDIPSLLKTAQRFLGVPYQWGGATAKGLDCSGFVQTLFRLHGIVLPRDSVDQFRFVKRQSYVYRDGRDLQYGHLAFFGESDAKVSHVALGLADGRYIHARGRVRLNSMRSEDPDFDRDLFSQFRGAGPVLLQ